MHGIKKLLSINCIYYWLKGFSVVIADIRVTEAGIYVFINNSLIWLTANDQCLIKQLSLQ